MLIVQRRYIMRPALANERVQCNAAGQVVLTAAATAPANDCFTAVDLGGRMPGLGRVRVHGPQQQVPGSDHKADPSVTHVPYPSPESGGYLDRCDRRTNRSRRAIGRQAVIAST